jgi:hypothetical protein
MRTQRKTAQVSPRLRELSDKELNEIARAVGDRARAQTIEQKKRLKADLLKEMAATRAAFRSQGKRDA